MQQRVITILAILFTLTLATTGYSQTTSIKKDGDKIIYRDKHGKVTGTSTTSGDTTTYRDANGNITSTAVSSGDKTTIRSKHGKRAVTVKKPKK